MVQRSNLANNLFASSCDSLRPIIAFATRVKLEGLLMSNAEIIALIDVVLALPVSGSTKNDLRSFHAFEPQKWDKMAKLNKRRRWRGPALGGRLQRAVRFCFTAHNGEASTPTLTEWARPEIVHAGRRPTAAQMVNQARALRSIGAKRVRRAGCGWVWRLDDGEV
jgi:hypothetical protein